MSAFGKVNCFFLLLLLNVFPNEVVDCALTEAQKATMLNAHNQLRRHTAKGLTKDKNGQAQPKAADMMEMVNTIVHKYRNLTT